jgi:hypothetical protein
MEFSTSPVEAMPCLRAVAEAPVQVERADDLVGAVVAGGLRHARAVWPGSGDGASPRE